MTKNNGSGLGLYIARKSDDRPIDALLSDSVQSIKAMISTKQETSVRNTKDHKKSGDFGGDSLARYIDSNSSARFLIRAMHRYLLTVAKTDIERMFSEMFDSSKRLRSYKGYEIGEVSEMAFNSSARRVDEALNIARSFHLIPSALLMAAVSSFDAFLADFLRQAVKDRPDALKYSNKQMDVKDILSASSIDEIKDIIIDEEIEDVIRESHYKQVEYIKKICKFDPFDKWERRNDYLEIFERRNLAAHGIPTFNTSYCNNMKAFGAECGSRKGKPLEVKPEYLRYALDIFIEFSVLCGFQYASKLPNADLDAIFKEANSAVLLLLRQNRSKPAMWITDYLLKHKAEGITDHARKTSLLYNACALIIAKRRDDAIAMLEGYDWSATSDEFQLQVAALRGDFETMKSVLPRVKASGALDFEAIKGSPIFREARKNEELRDFIERTFGQSFPILKRISPTDTMVESEDEPEREA